MQCLNKKEEMMTRLAIRLALICAVFPVYSFAGIEWSATIVTTGKGKKANNEINTHTYAQAGNVKQVFEGVLKEDMYYFKDGYWLYKTDEDNIYVVNEKEHNYTVISMDGLLQLTGMLGQFAEIEILDHSIVVEELPSGVVLGYPCNHLKITTDYTMKLKIVFIKKTIRMHEEKEIWSTTKIQGLEELNRAFQQKEYKTGIPDLDNMIQKNIEQHSKIGFLLKTISTSSQMTKKGKETGEKVTTKMTVNEVKNNGFPSAFFEIADDYDRVLGPWEQGMIE
jgi:hypothetical protein